MFRARWYGSLSVGDTWKPIEGLPCSSVTRYLEKVRKVEWTILDNDVGGRSYGDMEHSGGRLD